MRAAVAFVVWCLLCRNPLTAENEHRTREMLIGNTREVTEALAKSRKRRASAELGGGDGKAVSEVEGWEALPLAGLRGKAGMGSEREACGVGAFAGRSIRGRTVVFAEAFGENEVVACYRQLVVVERDFRQLKTTSIGIRPTCYHKDDRVEAHALSCVLAYYIQWHMGKRLAPLFAADGKGKDRRRVTAGVLKRLKGIR